MEVDVKDMKNEALNKMQMWYVPNDSKTPWPLSNIKSQSNQGCGHNYIINRWSIVCCNNALSLPAALFFS